MAEPSRPRTSLPLALLLAAAGCAGLQPSPDLMASAAEEGRNADRAMAAAVAAGIGDAFAGHVAQDGIFFSTQGPAAGRTAVTASWGVFFSPGGPRLAWTPDRAVASPSGDLVFTFGPWTWTPPPGAGGAPQTGRYMSVWRRDPDGQLRVVFDGGDVRLPALPDRVTRRPLRSVSSADGTLLAEGGLLLDGAREAGWYLRLARCDAQGCSDLSEGGAYSRAGP